MFVWTTIYISLSLSLFFSREREKEKRKRTTQPWTYIYIRTCIALLLDRQKKIVVRECSLASSNLPLQTQSYSDRRSVTSNSCVQLFVFFLNFLCLTSLFHYEQFPCSSKQTSQITTSTIRSTSSGNQRIRWFDLCQCRHRFNMVCSTKFSSRFLSFFHLNLVVKNVEERFINLRMVSWFLRPLKPIHQQQNERWNQRAKIWYRI